MRWFSLASTPFSFALSFRRNCHLGSLGEQQLGWWTRLGEVSLSFRDTSPPKGKERGQILSDSASRWPRISLRTTATRSQGFELTPRRPDANRSLFYIQVILF